MNYNSYRRKTKAITVGSLGIGGEYPLTVQSMTNTDTHDVEATYDQVKRLADAGCDIVRITAPDEESVKTFSELKARGITTPLVADIHFDYRIALACAEAGVDKIRINPGNIGSDEKVKAVVELLPYSSGLKRNIVQCLNDYNIPLLLSHTVTKIHGRDRLEGVTIGEVGKDRKVIDGTEEYIPCDTLLLSVGLLPENELSKRAGVKLSSITGGAIVDDNLESSINGIFACGNVLHVHDLVDNVTLESYNAGKNAADFIKGKFIKGEKVKVNAVDGVRYTVPQLINTPLGLKEILSYITTMIKLRNILGKKLKTLRNLSTTLHTILMST